MFLCFWGMERFKASTFQGVRSLALRNTNSYLNTNIWFQNILCSSVIIFVKNTMVPQARAIDRYQAPKSGAFAAQQSCQHLRQMWCDPHELGVKGGRNNNADPNNFKTFGVINRCFNLLTIKINKTLICFGSLRVCKSVSITKHNKWLL